MQRWEYLLVACVPHSMVMRPKYENGGLIRDWVEGNVKKVLISVALWLPYLLLSTRVNVTFRHRLPA